MYCIACRVEIIVCVDGCIDRCFVPSQEQRGDEYVVFDCRVVCIDVNIVEYAVDECALKLLC